MAGVWERKPIKGTHYTSICRGFGSHPTIWAGPTEQGWSAQFAHGERGLAVQGMRTRQEAADKLLSMYHAKD